MSRGDEQVPVLRLHTCPVGQLLSGFALGSAGLVRFAPSSRGSLSSAQSLSESVSRKSGRPSVSVSTGFIPSGPRSTLSGSPSPSLSRSRYEGVLSMSGPKSLGSRRRSTAVGMPSLSSSGSR